MAKAMGKANPPTITIFRNGTRLGQVSDEGLRGELCWAVELDLYGAALHSQYVIYAAILTGFSHAVISCLERGLLKNLDGKMPRRPRRDTDIKHEWLHHSGSSSAEEDYQHDGRQPEHMLQQLDIRELPPATIGQRHAALRQWRSVLCVAQWRRRAQQLRVGCSLSCRACRYISIVACVSIVLSLAITSHTGP